MAEEYYNSKYFTCEEIDQRLLQAAYDDAVKKGYSGTKEEFDSRLAFLVGKKTIGEVFNNIEGNAATGSYSHAEGYQTTASNSEAHAEGNGTTASGTYSHAEGHATTAEGSSTHSEGNNTQATGNYSHAEGNGTKSVGENSHAEGNGTTSQGNHSHAEGNGTIAEGVSSHSEGYSTKAKGTNSHAEGNTTTAEGTYSHAEGTNTMAKGPNSHAEGYQTTAEGNYSHAEGNNTLAYGSASHAEGYQTTAEGNYSHAEGNNTLAYGSASHAEGTTTTAEGSQSHAEGYQTFASGETSHAEGNGTTASGYSSHSANRGTVSDNYAQTSIGMFNEEDTNPSQDNYNVTKPALLIGNGGGPTSRGNAFKVLFNGQTFSDGQYSSSGADYAEMFEWEDQNPDNDDRVGLFVTLVGDRIKLTKSTDTYILGIISAAPTIIGDNPMRWHNKYLNDEWGRPVYEDVTVHYTEIETIDGVEKEVEKTRVDHIRKLNPAYMPTEPYTPRSERPEWDYVGVMGKLLVKHDGTLLEGSFCKPGNDGVATKSDKGYYVMKVINNTQALIFFK